MTAILQRCDEWVSGILQPIIDDGHVVQISIRPLNTPEDVAALMQEYKDRVPAGFLSVPQVAFQSTPNPAIVDLTLNYIAVLFFGADKAAEDANRAKAYAWLETFAAAFVNKAPAWARPYVKRTELSSFAYFGNGATISFSLTLKDWSIASE